MPKIYRAVAPSVEKERLVTRQTECKARSDFCIVFHAAELLLCGYSYLGNNSTHFMGTPTFKISSGCTKPFNSKIEEAILTFIPRNEENKRLNENMVGVDLGACPGGWTYQLGETWFICVCS